MLNYTIQLGVSTFHLLSQGPRHYVTLSHIVESEVDTVHNQQENILVSGSVTLDIF